MQLLKKSLVLSKDCFSCKFIKLTKVAVVPLRLRQFFFTVWLHSKTPEDWLAVKKILRWNLMLLILNTTRLTLHKDKKSITATVYLIMLNNNRKNKMRKRQIFWLRGFKWVDMIAPERHQAKQPYQLLKVLLQVSKAKKDQTQLHLKYWKLRQTN